MDEIQWLFDNADKASLPFVAAIFILAIHRKWIVPGYVYADKADCCEARGKKLDDSAAKMESKLDRLEGQANASR